MNAGVKGNPLQEMAARIREMRGISGYSVRQMAGLTDVTEEQYAAIEAYSNRTDCCYLKREYDSRRQIVIRDLSAAQSLSLGGIDAAFYAFVNISRTGLDSRTFARELLLKERVAVVPGFAYGDAYDDYIRIAFTVPGAVLHRALERIVRFAEES